MNEKESWGPGPWQEEPDRLEFRSLGYPCLMVRNMRIGNWCGYVAVPPGHPAYKKDYDEVRVDVHGGLTYSGPCRGEVYHKPQEGESDDVWWLGFDCAHGFDLIPKLKRFFQYESGMSCQPYRDLAYVKKEVIDLASQLADMVHKNPRIKVHG